MSTQFFIAIWPFYLAAAIAGLLLGSFLNVCIIRLPAHRSVVTPRSKCNSCNQPIRAMENIPVLSWLCLRGRCRSCHARISLQYPLVEISTALLFIACLYQTGLGWPTLLHATACFFLLGLAVMDAQTMLLPDTFTLTGLGVAFVMKISIASQGRRVHIALQTLLDAAAAAALLLLVYAAYWVIRRRHGVGMGDVKLLAMIAAFLGLPVTLLVYFLGVLAAAVWAIVLVAGRKATGSDKLPFGSFLAASAIFAVFAGKTIVAWYIGLFH